MNEFETTIEVPVKVIFSVEPAQKGSCDSMGVPEEPSWDAYVDDIEVIYPDQLDDEIMDQLRREAEDYIREEREENELQRKLSGQED
jgi:hypothetical protein